MFHSVVSDSEGRTRRILAAMPWCLASLLGLWAVATAGAQEASTPHWIWHPSRAKVAGGGFPAETRYFRKAIAVKESSRLVLDVTADDAFTLYLDGKEVAKGADWRRVKGVEARLAIGPHVLAIVARNAEPGTAGVLVRGGVLPLGQGVPVHTDGTWKATGSVPTGPAWTELGFDDAGWSRAEDLGPLGSGPWTGLVFESGDTSDRFKVPDGYRVTMVGSPEVTGSVVSLAFDPEGRPCVGVEGKPIARLIDADRDGTYEASRVITPTLSNCQGFSFIRGVLYAVGKGPAATGIHRLKDLDGDGVYEATELVRDTVYVQGGRAVPGMMQEHGPHAVMLGPDGRLYFNNGNHVHLTPPIDPHSPVNISYEGELLPHFNDSRGHAAGILAPCGEVLRSDDDGKTWKRVSAGYRNHYDFAFNRDGEAFTYDSDMEWDVGLPWYRPVRVLHAAVGGEFGSRNGSAAWPDWYFDSLPSTLGTGRGSPTGVTFYQGDQFPALEDNFLICDWSQGRILAVALTRQGASYAAKATELVTGQPLNCTDIEVGPDRNIYFTTGGRGTQGGLFKISRTGPPPPGSGQKPPPETEAGAVAALHEMLARSESPLASFNQARLLRAKRLLGEKWDRRLSTVVAGEPGAPPRAALRAFDFMAQLGPEPSDALLATLAQHPLPEMRTRALGLLGLRHSDDARAALVKALADPDPFARRRACEGLMQQPSPTIPIARLVPLLADPDRHIRYAARVAIEHGDIVAHRAALLAVETVRQKLEAMLALARASRLDERAQDDLFARQVALLKLPEAVSGGKGDPRSTITPGERLDLLRLIEVTYLLGPRKAEAPASAAFRPLLLGLYPSRDRVHDRELSRLLAYLDEPRGVAAILKEQAVAALRKGDLAQDRADQIHDAYCLRVIRSGWTATEKRQLWAWYEAASHWDGGYSFLGYLDFMVQDLVGLLDEGERTEALAVGERDPFPTRVLVRALDLDARPARIAELSALYARLVRTESTGNGNELRGLIVETLGRSPRREAHAAIRALALLDPARRDPIARALADHPTAEDLPLLVAALESRDPNTTSTVLGALQKIEAAPAGPEGLRNLIRLARRTGPPIQGALDALAGRWTGRPRPGARLDFATALEGWERLYAERYPMGPALGDAAPTGENAYTYAELLQNVVQSGLMRDASPDRGKLVIERARCLDCHKFGDKGQGLGPDLTTVNSRFRPFEILESIVLPSKVISDQYKPMTIATRDGKVTNGMPVANDANTLVLLLSDGTKATLAKADVEETKESKTSVMPENLLNALSYQEVADLIALFNSMPRVAAPSETDVKKSQ